MTFNLKAAREKLGLTQAQLAEQLDVRTNTIARWERGDLKTPHETMLRLAVEHLLCKSKQQPKARRKRGR